MQFIPRQPDTSVNTTPTAPIKEFFNLSLALVALVALLTAASVFFADIAVALIPPKAESRIASLFLNDRQNQPHAKVAWLQGILDRLAEDWKDNPYSLRVLVTKNPEKNAFALPGGIVLVTSGLLESAESENEAAFFLGHEIGHFRHRDHLKSFGRRILPRMLILTLFGSANMGPVNWTTELTNRKFSRADERSADEYAVELLQKAYGHAGGYEQFFNKVLSPSKLENAVHSYLSTHPNPEERMQHLAQYAAERNWKTAGELIAMPKQ